MSMLSRGGERKRGAVGVVSTLAFGLFAYIFVAAVPAMAVTIDDSTCEWDGANEVLAVFVGTDDVVLLAANGGGLGDRIIDAESSNEYVWSVNGAPFVECDGTDPDTGDIAWVDVTGAGNGTETFGLFHPNGLGDGSSMTSENFTVDLGNGNDTFVIEYGARNDLSLGGANGDLDDPGVAVDSDNCVSIGTSFEGRQVVNFNADSSLPTSCDGPTSESADVGLDDSTISVVVNTGMDDDVVDAGMFYDDIDASSTIGVFDEDNLPAADQGSETLLNVTVNAGINDDDMTSGAGNDVFNGGPDDDEVNYQSSPSGIVASLITRTATGHGNDILNDIQDLEGSEFADTLTGDAIDNEIDGFGGDDVIVGNEGDDDLQGQNGDDDLTGGAGSDDVDGQGGSDTVHEGPVPSGTDDLFDSGPGTDTLDYGERTGPTVIDESTNSAGADASVPPDGDSADVGDERDVIGGYEILITGSGNDTLIGGGDGESFFPGAGNDSITGNGGTDDVTLGDAGPTTITITSTGPGAASGTSASDQGNDTFGTMELFFTTPADDTLIPANGNFLDPDLGVIDWFAGGGHDVIDASATTIGVFADMSNLGAAASPFFGTPACNVGVVGVLGDGNCTDVEDFHGGSGDDTVAGTLRDNMLITHAGDDVANGGAGNDFLDAGLGDDVYGGGLGSDTASYRAAPGAVEIDNQASFGGGATGAYGSDSFVGDLGGFEIVLMSDFGDTFRAGQTDLDANIRVLGFLGDDSIVGSNSVDLLRGGGGNDFLRGGLGDDDLRGSGGDDVLVGDAGSDFMQGGSGSDIGRGGRGFDVCQGVEFPNSC